jgi:protein-S-isoprenylcysteine O-methyltransferase Ste14
VRYHQAVADVPAHGSPLRLLMRVPVPWVFVLAYLIGVGLQYAAPLELAGLARPSTSVAGFVLFGVGAMFAGWGWFLFRKADTTRVPGQASTALVTWGPYRLSRNPMYLGLAVAYLGEAGILRQAWPVLVLPLVVLYLSLVVIPVEEARLREVFGGAYEAYCAKVRRWI